MPRFNDKFELSIEDMELIEEALRRSKRELAGEALGTARCDMKNGEEAADSVRQIHDLLGRLHNQKVFYRPQNGSYISG